MQAIFIRIEDTLEKAMYYQSGVQMQFYSFNGIQLLTNQAAPYVQRTNCSNGVAIADFTVTVMSMCGTELAEITESFKVDSTFQDENTGLWQLYWSLKNVTYDAGLQLIYLRIETGANGVYYTSPFMLTSQESESTHRFHYRNREIDPIQSTGLKMYYRQDSDLTTLELYTTLGGKKQIQQNLSIVEFEIFQTKIVDYQILKAFKRMCTFVFRYMDFKPFNLIEVPETKEFENNENFDQQVIKIQRDFNPLNEYNPFYVPPAPPPVPPVLIILNSVQSTGVGVTYDFTVEDISPSYLYYQYSLDGINWDFNPSSPQSPRTITVLNNQTENYFYRIYSPEFDTYSNVLQLAQQSIVLNSVVSADGFFRPSGNKYIYDFTLNGFAPDTQLIFETMINDNIGDFVGFTTYEPGNESPKQVNTGASTFERTMFRIRYVSANQQLQLTSNIAYFEF